MTRLKKAALIVLLLPILLVVVSLFLPSRYRVERSLAIKAPPEAIFARVNTLKLWPEWSAWTVARYPDMQVSYSGPEVGVGATYSWQGKSSGQGSLKITGSDLAKGITYDLDFESGKYISKGTIALQPSGDTVQVIWTNEGDLGWNPVSRVFGLLMDKWMGPDMEMGLLQLQRLVETPTRP